MSSSTKWKSSQRCCGNEHGEDTFSRDEPQTQEIFEQLKEAKRQLKDVGAKLEQAKLSSFLAEIPVSPVEKIPFRFDQNSRFKSLPSFRRRFAIDEERKQRMMNDQSLRKYFQYMQLLDDVETEAVQNGAVEDNKRPGLSSLRTSEGKLRSVLKDLDEIKSKIKTLRDQVFSDESVSCLSSTAGDSAVSQPCVEKHFAKKYALNAQVQRPVVTESVSEHSVGSDAATALRTASRSPPVTHDLQKDKTTASRRTHQSVGIGKTNQTQEPVARITRQNSSDEARGLKFLRRSKAESRTNREESREQHVKEKDTWTVMLLGKGIKATNGRHIVDIKPSGVSMPKLAAKETRYFAPFIEPNLQQGLSSSAVVSVDVQQASYRHKQGASKMPERSSRETERPKSSLRNNAFLSANQRESQEICTKKSKKDSTKSPSKLEKGFDRGHVQSFNPSRISLSKSGAKETQGSSSFKTSNQHRCLAKSAARAEKFENILLPDVRDEQAAPFVTSLPSTAAGPGAIKQLPSVEAGHPINDRRNRHSRDEIRKYMKERRENELKQERVKVLSAEKQKVELEQKLSKIIARQRQLATRVTVSTRSKGTRSVEPPLSEKKRVKMNEIKKKYLKDEGLKPTNEECIEKTAVGKSVRRRSCITAVISAREAAISNILRQKEHGVPKSGLAARSQTQRSAAQPSITHAGTSVADAATQVLGSDAFTPEACVVEEAVQTNVMDGFSLAVDEIQKAKADSTRCDAAVETEAQLRVANCDKELQVMLLQPKNAGYVMSPLNPASIDTSSSSDSRLSQSEHKTESEFTDIPGAYVGHGFPDPKAGSGVIVLDSFTSASKIFQSGFILSSIVDDGSVKSLPQVNEALSRIKASGVADRLEHLLTLGDFEIGRMLGRGRFGCVFLAREKKSHFVVALKVLFKKQLVESRMERQLTYEISNQLNLKHPNILQMYTFFHDARRVFLVLEYASNGEVYKKLKACTRFPEEQAARYIYQMCDALIYCHSKGIIHRDIKPENLLLGSKNELKLADFGCSVQVQSDGRRSICGTLDYLPPEMLDRLPYTNSVDLWSLGVLLYEFLVGETPFYSCTQAETLIRIRNVLYSVPNYVSAGARDLIEKLLRKNPSSRLPLADVMKHQWIVANYVMRP